MPARILVNDLYGTAKSPTLFRVSTTLTASASRWLGTRTMKPLRILFCGSDEFSCESLRAIHQEQQRNSNSIESIDVMIRPGKPYGRGLHSIREVPLKGVAQEFGLVVHERNTFTSWKLPRPNGHNINLIIAVSFGLFVPPRILNSVKYGGINIHPSLLPDFRGPAPLHHVLLAGDAHIGVTLQTLHPEKFDHGAILVQTPQPGFAIPNHSECTYPELLEFIAPRAAALLIQGLRDRVFVPPIKDITSTLPHQDPRSIRLAPKITTADRQINWNTMTASEICRLDRVIGRLWNIYNAEGEEPRRIIFHDLEKISPPQIYLDWQQGKHDAQFDVGRLPVIGRDGKPVKGPQFLKHRNSIVVLTEGGQALLIREITVAGEKRLPAVEALFGK